MANMKMHSAWDGAFKGQGRIEAEGWGVDFAIPKDLGGSDVGANPKELFTAATLACFTATLRAITAGKKVPVEKLSVETNAHADDDAFAIRHVAHILLIAGSDEAAKTAALNAINTADKVCVVGNIAKKAGVTIEVIPDVQVSAA